MKLALERGVSYADFLRTTSAREVQQYRALNMIDPIFPGERIDRAAALVACNIFNMWRGADSPATSISDWLPDYTAWMRPPQEVADEAAVPEQIDRFLEGIGAT